jgi:TatD DNase family protein
MYFDSHSHLDQDDFADDLDQVIDRARLARVTNVMLVGVTPESSERSIAISDRFDLHAAVGIQPNYVSEVGSDAWDRIVALSAHPRTVALGETGLDRYWDDSTLPLQQDYFDRHLRLSQQINKPFIVHLRNSEEEILVMLREARERGPLAGVMHSYCGTLEGARECIAMGLYISFAGMLTYKNAADLREVAAALPLDRLLVETDSPYLSPEPVRKIRRNEPAHVIHTCRRLAELRGEPVEQVAHATTANARRLFFGD